jgi:hypothetical protein
MLFPTMWMDVQVVNIHKILDYNSSMSQFLQGPERHDPKLEPLEVSSKAHPGHSAGTPGQNRS